MVGIVAEDVERVRQAANLVELVSKHAQLRKVGRRWQGLCPFHAEKTPSFSVNGEDGLYYCFGCQARGDAITFVREIEHTDFVGAVEQLAAGLGITLRYDQAGESREHQRRKRLIDAMGAAVEWYHQRLLSSPDAAAARGYLRSRGFDGETVRRYRLGWAPDEWSALANALRLPDDVLRDTGLGYLNQRNRQTDAFRGRVLFPIFDAQGDPVAFGGRIMPGAEGPKYKNSPETPIYSKSRVLYGLNWAKTDVVARDEIILCEGYTDVIGFAQAGIARAVATCGTSLTEQHVEIIRRFARNIVLAFDADAAGQGAAARVYEWERKYDISVQVAPLPPGSDPADLARTDPAALEKAVKDKVPFLGFRVDRALGGADLATAEGRARAAEAALGVVAEHPNEIIRRDYAGQVAMRCNLPAADLVRLAERRGSRVARPAVDTNVRTGRDADGPETTTLLLLVHRWDDIAAYLTEALYADEVALGAFRALAATSTIRDAIDTAPPEAAALLARLDQRADDAAEFDDPAREAGHLIAVVAERRLEQTRADHDTYATLVGWLKPRIEQVRADGAGSEAGSQLLTWLDGRNEGTA